MQTEFTCIKRLGAGHKADLKIGKHDASTNADEPRKLRLTEGAGERFQGSIPLGRNHVIPRSETKGLLFTAQQAQQFHGCISASCSPSPTKVM